MRGKQAFIWSFQSAAATYPRPALAITLGDWPGDKFLLRRCHIQCKILSTLLSAYLTISRTIATKKRSWRQLTRHDP